jgi:two-component system, LuxR family, response regulator FixJ
VNGPPLVHVVDDNPALRDSLRLLLTSVALDVRTYASSDEFLRQFGETSDRPAVLLLDVRMPGMSGMTLLERLRCDYPALPVIMITGHGDIDMAVRAMKLGATDFISKPFSSQALLDRVQDLMRQACDPASPQLGSDEAAARLANLTAREREVFDRIVGGEANKVIAHGLGISVRTVESHRASLMQKLGARTLVDLVLISVHRRGAPEGLS